MADAGRVIAGSAKGIHLRAPGPGTRPLADRVKQTLFAILEPELADAHVLDLFAGSGAGGIEALSRGAASVTFIEKDQGAAAVIDANLRATSLAGPQAAIIRWDAVQWLAEPNVVEPFDLVLVDPPYELVESLQVRLSRYLPDVVAEDGLLVFESAARDEPELPLHKRTSRRYGSARLTLFENE